jgi:hypothetical protein
VEKIVRTLASRAEQDRLRQLLTASERFSTAHFVTQVRDIVDTFT